MRRVATIQKAAFSDHRPKMTELRTNIRKWRQAGRPNRAPNLRYKMLRYKHFEDLSAQKYEREPHEIEAVMLEMKELRMKESALGSKHYGKRNA